jgi:sugar-phosphatase
VVEDAPAGLLSGLAAGCRTIAVNVPADAPVWMKPTSC